MISLLDVNVLIALADADHPHASAALEFFKDHAVRDGWATKVEFSGIAFAGNQWNCGCRKRTADQYNLKTVRLLVPATLCGYF